jgi:hypothetical protein
MRWILAPSRGSARGEPDLGYSCARAPRGRSATVPGRIPRHLCVPASRRTKYMPAAPRVPVVTPSAHLVAAGRERSLASLQRATLTSTTTMLTTISLGTANSHRIAPCAGFGHTPVSDSTLRARDDVHGCTPRLAPAASVVRPGGTSSLVPAPHSGRPDRDVALVVALRVDLKPRTPSDSVARRRCS